MSEQSYLDDFFPAIAKELADNLLILRSEFPDFLFSKESMYLNQKYISSVLNPAKTIHASFDRACENGIELALGNLQQLPVQIIQVCCKDTRVFLPTREILLPGKAASDNVNYQNERFRLPAGFSWSDSLAVALQVHYRLLGRSAVQQETVSPWPNLDRAFTDKDFIRQKPNIETFGFLEQENQTRQIFIKPGDWELTHSLIVPPGFRLCCSEKTRLRLSKSALILSYSPLEFVGTEDFPIVVESVDSTGQGIVVINAGASSVLDYVVFKNLSNPSQQGWQLTGAVSF